MPIFCKSFNTHFQLPSFFDLEVYIYHFPTAVPLGILICYYIIFNHMIYYMQCSWGHDWQLKSTKLIGPRVLIAGVQWRVWDMRVHYNPLILISVYTFEHTCKVNLFSQSPSNLVYISGKCFWNVWSELCIFCVSLSTGKCVE